MIIATFYGTIYTCNPCTFLVATCISYVNCRRFKILRCSKVLCQCVPVEIHSFNTSECSYTLEKEKCDICGKVVKVTIKGCDHHLNVLKCGDGPLVVTFTTLPQVSLLCFYRVWFMNTPITHELCLWPSKVTG